jgi:hypothetical protein
MGGGSSQQEKTSQQYQGQQQQAAQQQEGQSSATLGQYMGNVQSTPYYQSLLKSGTQSTNQAYDQSARNLKQSMEGAGVSGMSGASAGNNAAMDAQRANALGQVSTNALQGATAQQDTALGLSNQLAGTESQAATQYGSQATQEEMQQNQEQAGMWSALLGAGMGVAEGNPFGLTGM